MHNPVKRILDFTGFILSAPAKSLLSQELDFTIPPKNIKYANYMLPSKLLYRDVDSSEVSKLDNELIKSRLRDPAFLSYTDSDRILKKELTKSGT